MTTLAGQFVNQEVKNINLYVSLPFAFQRPGAGTWEIVMTSEFGKVLRKVRVDMDLTLADLARRMEVSAAYLSCLETGKKPVPPSFVDTLIEALELREPEASKLRDTAVLTRSKAVVIPLEGRDAVAKKLAVAFARRMEGSMTGSQAQALLQLLEPQKKVKAHAPLLHRSTRAK